MRIATWNVNGLRARLDFVRHWLAARQPDVVGLQELKLSNEQFPYDELEAEGYRAQVWGQKAWNGVAVLTRDECEVVQQGLPGQEDFGSRLLTVKVGELLFTTVYVPNGKTVSHEDYPRKLAWLDDLTRHFTDGWDGSRQRVLCGDFNLCPQPIDSWNESALNGKIHHTDEERQRFRQLLELGFEDAFREKHPDTQAFSWWDYRGGAFHRKMGLRIDFLMTTRPVTTRVRHIEIDRDYRKKKDGLIPSDHAPVFADLE